MIAWLVAGTGFLCLALSLNYLSRKRSDLPGLFAYASEGFGPFAGFISGWGYWFSAWLGSVAFATMMVQTLGYFFPIFMGGNTIPAILLASVFNWVMVFLVIRGVESAAFLNALVMLAKVASIGVFIAFAAFLFSMDVFTADFWGMLSTNIAAMAGLEFDFAVVAAQVAACMVIMMWVFIGIEGATVMSARAEKQSDVGKATVIGIVCLLVIYVSASVLPYGYLPYTEIAALEYPAMLYVFDMMAPGWGGAFISIAILISIAGSWLSFTILPAETTSEMAKQNLLASAWGKLNDKGAPQMSLLVIGACIQVFLLTLLFTEDAYAFAFSLATVAIVFTWVLASAYEVKLALAEKQPGWALVGIVASVFLVVGCVLSGWYYLLLTCIGFVIGFFFYRQARQQQGIAITNKEYVLLAAFVAASVIALVMLFTGYIVV